MVPIGSKIIHEPSRRGQQSVRLRVDLRVQKYKRRGLTMSQQTAPEYDVFEYRHFDEPPMSLEEATRRAAELRLTQKGSFHRVTARDAEMTSFRVDSVPRASVYVEMVARWSTVLNRFACRLIGL